MASVDEVRAGIGQANEKAKESFAALQQAISSLEQAQAALAAATQGSQQGDADQAKSLLANATRAIGEAQQSVTAAIDTADGYAQRL
jgi:flagellar hook-basal body complex protein FliE